jgi:7tm Chemosensory receptor
VIISSSIKFVMTFRELHGPLLILELTGLQFFSLKGLRSDDDKRNPTTLRVVYLFVVAVSLGLINYALKTTNYYTIDEKLTSKNALRITFLNILSYSLLVFALASLVLSFVTTKNVQEFFINSDKISDIIDQKFNSTFDFVTAKHEAFKKLIVMLIAFIALHATAGAFQIDSTPNMIAWAIGMPVVMFFFIVLYKFTVYVGIINAQLVKVKDLIEKLFKCEPLRIQNAFEMEYQNMKQFKHSEAHETSTMKLRAIRDVYSMVSSNAEIVNMSNGLSILILILILVAILTDTGYEMFTLLVVNSAAEDVAREHFVLKLFS